MANIKGETLALAALFQCSSQITRIANTGYMDEHAVSCVFRALVVTNPKTVEDIYAPGKLITGFKQLVDSFDRSVSAKTPETIAITQISLKIISLAISIMNKGDIFNSMGNYIDSITERILAATPDYLDASPDVVLNPDYIKEFAKIYQSIISPNFPKLVIYGEERILREESNQDRIRALLLCGIRAVILWRQLGGRRRFLIFRRKLIVQCAKQGAANGFLN